MTKQEKITLYKTALQYIAEDKETETGLCWMYCTDSIRITNLVTRNS